MKASRLPAKVSQELQYEDLWAYLPDATYIHTPSGNRWTAQSINAKLPSVEIGTHSDGRPITQQPHMWLMKNRSVGHVTWFPGKPQIMENEFVTEGGVVSSPGQLTYNMYRPPVRPSGGTASEAGPWVDLVRKVFPDEAGHLIAWFAHRVQRPHEKVNHAVVLIGDQGIGKDTILDPVKEAIGSWNWAEVDPSAIMNRFNGYVKSVVLRINEARDLGETDRIGFYEHMKVLTAAPPYALRVDEKHVREYHVPNLTSVVITSNHAAGGIYLPENDRRHFVALSPLRRSDHAAGFFDDYYSWLKSGGYAHVAALLAEYDLSAFKPYAPPPRTEAFLSIVEGSANETDSALAEALATIGNPDVFIVDDLTRHLDGDAREWVADRKNSRSLKAALDKLRYTAVTNSGREDGRWIVPMPGSAGERRVVYGKTTLLPADRKRAVKDYLKRRQAARPCGGNPFHPENFSRDRTLLREVDAVM